MVLKIDDVDTLFGVADTFTTVRYGDDGIIYGLPGLVYGALRSLGQVKPYMVLDSGLTIQQRIEPEQGKGNVGTITISLIDYQGAVSKIISPGQVVPEIMGKLCRVYIGFTETSFPDDYVLLYQGTISQIQCPPGLVKLQISDSTAKKRQPIFDLASTVLLNSIPATWPITGGIIQVANTDVLHKQILGPASAYDDTVQTYLVVDSEVMQYPATGILSATAVFVTRPAIGTALVAHDAGASVNGSVGFGFNNEGINAITWALKLLLSGWDGPCLTDVAVASFVDNLTGFDVDNEFVLQTDDAIIDLGLTQGDYFYITGSASGNSVSGTITGIEAGLNGRNTIIQTDQTFVIENPTDAVVAFRSKYDTFPVTCGVKCSTSEVDVPTFEAIRSTYFSAAGTSNLRAYYDQPIAGKDVVDTDIMLPLGCYSISRYGRISMAITKPPLPGSGTKLVQLDQSNVLDPDKIVVTRSTNQRSFYNQVSYEYDFDVATQTFTRIQYFIDTESITNFDDTVVLPIQAKALSAELGGSLIAQNRGTALLTRFKQCLIWIELSVNWSVGSLIEVSDIVLLKDEGNLKIMNFATGERNLGVDLYEVIDRTYNIMAGNVRLKLLGGLGFDLNSRFGLYSPSSIMTTGSTTTSIRVRPSYGQTVLSNEIAKWRPLLGMPVQVHSPDYSVTGASFLVSTDPLDASALIVAPALPFAPSSGYIMDLGPYPQDTDPTTDQLMKKLYAFYTPSIAVTAGLSQNEFNIAAAGAPLITVGNTSIVRSPLYDNLSPETKVLGVTGSTVQVQTALGFIPASGDFMEGIGFHDGTGYYRYN